jgi:hypothetical protein
VEEVEVWQDLANVYTELKQFRDAETCLEKAQALKTYSTVTWWAMGENHSSQPLYLRLITMALGRSISDARFLPNLLNIFYFYREAT